MSRHNELVTIRDKQFRIFIPNSKIIARIETISEIINKDFSDKRPVFIPVLNGAFFFGSHLIQRFKYECEVDFVKTTSYKGTESTGNVRIDASFKTELEDRHLLIIEDIVDSGLTMNRFMAYLKENFKPASIHIVTLFDKPSAREHEVETYISGFDIEPLFIVGFGLDYDGLGRNLPHIYQIVNQEL